MLQIADNLELAPEAMTLTSAILGIRGSGKTNTGVVFTEGLLEAGHQVIVIDPLDVWWGLKSSADGESPGHAIVVLGGAHGDLPLASGDGAVMADFLVETRTPAILSLRHLRKAEQKRFVADFAEQLYQRKGETGKNTSCLVVIDEASSFVPQGFQADSARMVGAIEDLVRRGRASGIGVMLIDQRAASVNKDVLTQLELLVAHRHTSPQDRAALKLWVQAHDTGEKEKLFLDSLASLPLGQAWFWSPEWLKIFERVTVRPRRTFDSSATPELGREVAAPAAVAEIDLGALRERLAARVEEIQNSDPKALRKRVQELEKQISEGVAPAEVREIVKEVRVEVPVLAPDELERLEAQAHDMIAMSKDLHATGAAILGRLANLHDVPANPVSTPVPEPAPQIVSEPIPATAAPPSRKAKGAASKFMISMPQQCILDALLAFQDVGLRDVARSNVAVLADQSPTSSGYRNNVSALKTLGLVDYPSLGRLALTLAGIEQANTSAAPPDLAALHRAWFARLSRPQTAILQHLIRIYPKSISRPALADLAGQSATSSGYRNNISALKTLGLLDYPQRGEVVATKLLFPPVLK